MTGALAAKLPGYNAAPIDEALYGYSQRLIYAAISQVEKLEAVYGIAEDDDGRQLPFFTAIRAGGAGEAIRDLLLQPDAVRAAAQHPDGQTPQPLQLVLHTLACAIASEAACMPFDEDCESDDIEKAERTKIANEVYTAATTGKAAEEFATAYTAAIAAAAKEISQPVRGIEKS